uniref:Uncharacterized protein n=1 Tax=Rangifer tarandus platyrhynchus TaxID=3082113 RepID=A0ACB0EMZ2_RANTA|nr:unnamed protein product [Rangifer tarandus platyrhynchus]
MQGPTPVPAPISAEERPFFPEAGALVRFLGPPGRALGPAVGAAGLWTVSHRCSHEVGKVLVAEAMGGSERPPGETREAEAQISGESGQRPQEVMETLVPVRVGRAARRPRGWCV